MAKKRLRVGVLDVESGHLHGTWLEEQLRVKRPWERKNAVPAKHRWEFRSRFALSIPDRFTTR